ncbi:MAG: hypothetical protein PHI84_08520 [Kiritimatiellae bacterium]|nr:hypothetical protein [Kiritimatiellia bacterium]
MADTVETVRLPALAGVEDRVNRIEIIRPLEDGDIKGLQQSRALLSVAQPVMTMFGVLHWNHDDLERFTESLGKTGESLPSPQLNANRLILNYIAAADALLEHFARIYKRQCRLKKIADTGFDELRRHLEQTDDVFEFFSKFRNHVLHAGLPVGSYTINNAVGTGRTWTITHESSDLMLDGRGDLASCRLLETNKTIDLVYHLNAFHKTMMTQIFNEAVNCFIEDLRTAHVFHESLVTEVRTRGSELRPCVMTSRTNQDSTFNYTFDILPVNLATELGIVIKKKVPATGSSIP